MSHDPTISRKEDQHNAPPPEESPPETRSFSTNLTSTTLADAQRGIDNFLLVRCLGQGGMGEVWEARQTEPVKRTVALKLIKPGISSSEILSRFEIERSALAVMDHPNVARILEAGQTQSGQPYFAMEFAEGAPLTRFCSENRLGIRERLALFRQICAGVQHAHQKGVIHRDLKPGNIIVSRVDGEPVAKVIDFGLAKAVTGTRLSAETLQTQFGQVLGTPKYMSPEQASFEEVLVDTRTDVYALGAILYELLTGTTPIDDPADKPPTNVLDILARIRELQPERPSQRLVKLEDKNRQNWAQRCSTPVQNQLRMLKGELDWIVLKALQLEPDERYESAGALGNDVQRFLNLEPVVARPPSRTYYLRKFIVKHKIPVAAALLVLVSLIGGILGTSWGLVEAKRAWRAESDRAESERNAKLDSEARLRLVESSNDVLAGIFEDLDIRKQSGNEPLESTLAKRIIQAHQQLDSSADEVPLSVARMKTRLGNSLLSLGFPSDAVPAFELAIDLRREHLGAEASATLESENGLAEAYFHTGNYLEAETKFRGIWQRQQETLGDSHQQTLVSLNNLAETLRTQGHPQEALPLIQQAYKLRKQKLGEKNQETLNSLNNLALTMNDLGRMDEALDLFRQSLELSQKVFGASHSDTLTSLNNLALCLFGNGDIDEALELLEQGNDLLKQENGPEHPNSLSSSSNLASAYLAAGKSDKATQILRPTFATMERKLGTNHPDTLTCLNNLAESYLAEGATDRAAENYRLAIERMRNLDPPHPHYVNCLQRLAAIHWRGGNASQAVELFEEALSVATSQSSAKAPLTLQMSANLGVVYLEADMPDKAVETLEDVVAEIPNHPPLARYRAELREAYFQAGNLDDLHDRVTSDLIAARDDFHSDSTELATALSTLGGDLIRLKRFPAAAEILTEAHQLRSKLLGESWLTYNTFSLLGEAKLGICQTSDADPSDVMESEQLLRESYEFLNSNQLEIPEVVRSKILIEAIDRLVKVAALKDDPDEKQEWMDRKSKIQSREDS